MTNHKISERKMLFLFILIFLFGIASSLDVSWLPSDADGPLPLSTNYRKALGKLCVMISSGQKLPPEMNSKLHIIKKLCEKLESSNGLLKSWLPWETFSNIANKLPVNKILITLTIAGT
jgi:hypothetical protein